MKTQHTGQDDVGDTFRLGYNHRWRSRTGRRIPRTSFILVRFAGRPIWRPCDVLVVLGPVHHLWLSQGTMTGGISDFVSETVLRPPRSVLHKSQYRCVMESKVLVDDVVWVDRVGRLTVVLLSLLGRRSLLVLKKHRIY